MVKGAKMILKKFGFNFIKFYQGIGNFSLKLAIAEQKLGGMIPKLRDIAPDISNQESRCKETFNAYWEFKRRSLHCFQCTLMLSAIDMCKKDALTVVDIGDSAGTHMLYLSKLAGKGREIKTLGVNLDARAIEKIKKRGQNAMLCRAEELDLKGIPVDLFTTFQMVEHLHNPALFFRKLAKKSACNRVVMTVPYLKLSRVGLHHTKKNEGKVFYAEDEHIFELNPDDWKTLLYHSGWKVIYDKVFYQYPRRIPVLSFLLSNYWKKCDFEGFWGAILEKDLSMSDMYMDWPDEAKL